MKPDENTIKQKILDHIPGASVVVADLTGSGSNFGIDIIAEQFNGKNVIQQHRMVYAALGDDMKELIHALQIKTAPKN